MYHVETSAFVNVIFIFNYLNNKPFDEVLMNIYRTRTPLEDDCIVSEMFDVVKAPRLQLPKCP